jgi:pyruvate/2-oxoglutarate dehydrogenase complex dihydrolipoamide dehydrogenase (E3) component
MSSYDVVIIGSGSAGFSAAQAAREVGAKVCMIERGKLGGECPNYACVPSKALLKAARVWRLMRRAREFGVTTSGMQVNFRDVLGYERKVVETITGGGKRGDRYVKLAERLKIRLEYGNASFVDEQTVHVADEDGGRTIVGKAFVIATGTVPFIPPIEGISDVQYLTSADVLSLHEAPGSLAIVGGGPVGCEYATFFSALGTRVTLIQSAPFVLHREDEDVALMAQQMLASYGVEVLVNAKTKRVWSARGGVHGLAVSVDGQVQTVAVEQIMIAAGKRAAVDGLALEKAGVALDERKNVKTSATGQTSAKHVFAAGDVSGGYLFTHTAHHEGYTAGANAARVALKKRSPLVKTNERVVPRVTFVDPEVASVGLTEAEAKKRFRRLLVGAFPIAGLGRAVTESSRAGLVKLIADGKTGKLVGGHIMGEAAGEMIHEISLAIYLNATMEDLAEMIHAYPTFSEAITGAANSAQSV